MRIKKKNVVGTARVFVPQKKAMQKLQLSLKDFRRLCILKGIYPREPLHAKKANKGNSQSRIYYHIKDIHYLASEPIINKFREYKIFLTKLNKAKAKKNPSKIRSLFKNKPVFRLDGLVLERYPTFSSAIQDLDDALCLCFAFAALTQSKSARYQIINESRRLTSEFMHYVIESKSLIKVFISIKGIYYQAEIMGEKVTWVVGHERSVGKSAEMDLSVMSNFVDFYVTMLSFVNFRLYKTLGLFYPPRIQNSREFNNELGDDQEEIADKIYSLAIPLERNRDQENEVTIDTFDNAMPTENGNLAEKLQQAQALHTLFSKMKFFINREVPKEPLTFVIRSCGGTVSWTDCPANVYSESSSLITHQVVDRNINQFEFNRIYIQPQWIFDCFNNRRLLPTLKYSPGVLLPPHLSPFVEESVGEYIPPERIEQLKESGQEVDHLIPNEPETLKSKKKSLKEKKKENIKEDATPLKMKVQLGKTFTHNKQMEFDEKSHNLKLREMMISKKHRRVYKKIKFGQKRKIKETNALKNKRAKLN